MTATTNFPTGQFYNDEKELLETYFTANFYPYKHTPLYSSPTLTSLDLFITPECNQNCEYCYLKKHESELYPAEIHKSKEEIIHNLVMLMDYFVYEKKYMFSTYELYAGDLFITNYFFDLLDTLFPYFEYMFNKAPEFFRDQTVKIVIPTNLHFVEDDELVDNIYRQIAKYMDLKVRIVFSWSHDGKYSVNLREKHPITQAFYDKAFNFINKSGGGIHPMITPQGIDKAIDNYDWWTSMYDKYLPNRVEQDDFMPEFLELREGDWTEEKIETYCQLLKHMLEDLIERKDNDLLEVAKYLFITHGAQKKDGSILLDSVSNFTLYNDTMVCSQNFVKIRLADLAIVPCHRLAYPQFISGWFEVNEDNSKIIGLKPNNVSQLINIKHYKTTMAPKCVGCWNKFNCMHGCLGAQFEWSSELYLPIPKVCDLLKAKTSFTLKLLTESGIMQIAFQENMLDDAQKNHIKYLCNRLGYKIWREN